jgi:hypothetical protein
MADNYDFYVKQSQWQAEQNLLDNNNPRAEAIREREKSNNSLLRKSYSNNQNLVKRHTGHVFTKRKRNSNRKNSSSTKSKGGRKRKSGRKTKKNGW